MSAPQCDPARTRIVRRREPLVAMHYQRRTQANELLRFFMDSPAFNGEDKREGRLMLDIALQLGGLDQMRVGDWIYRDDLGNPHLCKAKNFAEHFEILD